MPSNSQLTSLDDLIQLIYKSCIGKSRSQRQKKFYDIGAGLCWFKFDERNPENLIDRPTMRGGNFRLGDICTKVLALRTPTEVRKAKASDLYKIGGNTLSHMMFYATLPAKIRNDRNIRKISLSNFKYLRPIADNLKLCRTAAKHLSNNPRMAASDKEQYIFKLKDEAELAAYHAELAAQVNMQATPRPAISPNPISRNGGVSYYKDENEILHKGTPVQDRQEIAEVLSIMSRNGVSFLHLP